MARQNRYGLVFHAKSGEKKYVTLNFKNNKRNTFSLTEIDYITSLFSDAAMLASFVGISNEEFDKGYFAIEYKSNSRLKSLELVFNDMIFLKDLAEKNLGESKVSKNSITGYMRWFLNKISDDPEFLKYISKNRYTNSYFKNALSEYLMYKNSDDKDAQSVLWQAKVRLEKEFTRYKTIRGLEVGRRNFELEKANKMVPRNPDELTSLQQAKLEYELNHPKKVKKRKPRKSDPVEGQLPLFDTTPYTDNDEHKRTRK